jgi:hypothetical protein
LLPWNVVSFHSLPFLRTYALYAPVQDNDQESCQDSGVSDFSGEMGIAAVTAGDSSIAL